MAVLVMMYIIYYNPSYFCQGIYLSVLQIKREFYLVFLNTGGSKRFHDAPKPMAVEATQSSHQGLYSISGRTFYRKIAVL